jgi:NDP-sugar pyrophosphorylase family protein
VGNRGSDLEMNVVVGEATMIGEQTHVKDSVIGGYCKIGNDVSIVDSFVWNNVVIKVICFFSFQKLRVSKWCFM